MVALFGVVVFLGAAPQTLATTITFPPVLLSFLPDAFALTTGFSSDGANFFDSFPGTFFAQATGAGNAGFGGSLTRGIAIADIPIDPKQPVRTKTFAFASAGKGEVAQVVSLARARSQLRFSASGNLFFEIDPSLVTSGDANAAMAFQATLDGDTIFSAAAMLDHGSLATSGLFSNSDFTLSSVGPPATATLTHTVFDVPISLSQVGKDLAFEFDQTYTANAADGGFAEVIIPEPATLVLLGSTLLGLALALRRPRQDRPRSRSINSLAGAIAGRHRAACALQVGLVCLLAAPAHAAEVKWKKDQNGLWGDGNNWAGNMVPGNNDDALDDFSGTLITHDKNDDVIKSLALPNSALLLSGGSLQATNGITLGGALNVGGGVLKGTKVTGSGKVSFTDAEKSVLDGDSFAGVSLSHTKGGLVTVKNGLTLEFRREFLFQGQSRLLFDGSQKLSGGSFDTAGAPKLELSAGTALTIDNAALLLAPGGNTTIGNLAAAGQKPTELTFTGLNRVAPKDPLSDNPTAVMVAANKITNRGGLRLAVGSNVTSYTVAADEFLNAGAAGIGANGGQDKFDVKKFTNDGRFTVNTSEFTVNTEAFTNNGTFEVMRNTDRVKIGPLGGKGRAAVNNGTVTVATGANLGFLAGYTQKAGLTTVSGNVDIQKDGKKTTGLLEGGKLAGNGTINGNLTVEKGIVKPGNSPGVLTIDGVYQQQPAGALDIEIDGSGFDPTTGIVDYSRLVVGDRASLDGLLEVTLGFTPSPGDIFTILTAGGELDGFFANALPILGSDTGWVFVDGGRFKVEYNETPGGPGSVVLEDFEVPEPSTAMIFGPLGLALFTIERWQGRRRRMGASETTRQLLKLGCCSTPRAS
jgi:hypothetical protein